MIHNCECEALNVMEHQNILLRDAFVAGIHSDSIRTRLLELDDKHATLDECIALANAIEMSNDYSNKFRTNSYDVVSQNVAAIEHNVPTESDSPTVAAANRRFYRPRKCYLWS